MRRTKPARVSEKPSSIALDLAELTVQQLSALVEIAPETMSVRERKLIMTELRHRLQLLGDPTGGVELAKPSSVEPIMSRTFSNLKQNAPPSGKTIACRTFQQELPSLCRAPATYSRWVLFVRDELVDVGETKRDLILKCNSKRLSPSEYFIGYVDEASADDFESGEINAWISEDVRGEEAVE